MAQHSLQRALARPPVFRLEDLCQLRDAELDPIQLDLRRRAARALHAEAVAGWNELHHVARFENTLRVLGDGGTLPPALVAWMKAQRQAIAAVRSMTIVFDVEHAAAPRLERFTRRFGKLNDQLALAQRDGGDERAAALAQRDTRGDWCAAAQRDTRGDLRAAALALLDCYQPRKLEQALLGFNAGRAADSGAFLADEAGTVLSLAASSQLEAEKFHELRKTLKHFMNILKLGARCGDDPGVARAARWFLALNEQLGAVNDAVVAAGADAPETLLLPRELGDAVANGLATLRW